MFVSGWVVSGLKCINFFFQARGEKHLIISLAQHMHQVHEMAAPEFLMSGVVVCPECTIWTMDDLHMKYHMAVHLESDVDTQQTSYECFLCENDDFTQSENGKTGCKFKEWSSIRDHFIQVCF